MRCAFGTPSQLQINILYGISIAEMASLYSPTNFTSEKCFGTYVIVAVDQYMHTGVSPALIKKGGGNPFRSA